MLYILIVRWNKHDFNKPVLQRSLSVCVCLLVFRRQFRKGLAQFLHCLFLQTIVKGLQGHSHSLILVHCHRRKLECMPTGLHHLRYLGIIERLFTVFHIKKVDRDHSSEFQDSRRQQCQLFLCNPVNHQFQKFCQRVFIHLLHFFL